ncbi:MAG: 16S rRNA (cytidine(1402)-2'-O)-methyltransferase [Candidatus Binataceae bacterium]|nr:16S rRNA (cytidine(1402)-2'-O)-methyltransferase [Candidatus Binataceae bacterium]
MNETAERGGPGVLYVVATPIGNLEDFSARAIRVLGAVDLIACEDTRRTARLLGAYSIRTPTQSYFEHNEERRTPELIARMAAGASVAIVTDAGTPSISDPGYRLVRAALAAGISVAAIPGPSAAIAALSISGLPSDRFTFEGFVPQRAAARRHALEAIAREPRTMIFYEAARRLAATIGAMAAAFGEDRAAVVVREITKIYEETVSGTLGELRARYAVEEARGEITIVVAGAPAIAAADGAGALTVEILGAAGLSLKQASAVLATLTGRGRREIYQEALARRGEDREDGSDREEEDGEDGNDGDNRK